MGSANPYVTALARSRILNEVAAQHGMTVAQMMGKNRRYEVVRARQEVMWRLNLLGMSTPRIGQWLKKDHSTVLHGIERHHAIERERHERARG